jgi:hypothetical protein
MSAAEEYRQLCAVYDPNVMSEETVRQWYSIFKNRRTNIHDEERSGQLAVWSE